ncbi:hypothetical protein [Agathobaculum sp.]|uniref:hypothetical protein n=1 Tax=Agathobaculum sp. TaxID=2048138 RepID=UPI002A81D7E1|nr:hypothetical protein [Agathobaculum sp.]MDY3617471.1 hypothetical protein [Agathobaculum sp.]
MSEKRNLAHWSILALSKPQTGPVRAFPYIERTGRGFQPAVRCLFSFANITPQRGFATRWLRYFSFPLKIHLKSRQLPAGQRFFKISFALVIRERGFWQPAGQKNFAFTSYNGEILKMPNIRAGKFLPSFTTTTGRGQNGREPERATKKAANLFQTYCFRWSPVAAGIQF